MINKFHHIYNGYLLEVASEFAYKFLQMINYVQD